MTLNGIVPLGLAILEDRDEIGIAGEAPEIRRCWSYDSTSGCCGREREAFLFNPDTENEEQDPDETQEMAR